MKPAYIQHPGRVIDTDSTFKHVMAIALDPRTAYKAGVLRCITSRTGDVAKSGFLDRSEIRAVRAVTADAADGLGGEASERFSIGSKLDIKHEKEIVDSLLAKGLDFIGLEDPDIWVDEKENLMHLYFTLPLIGSGHVPTRIHLGHAVGKDLDSLVMTDPVLLHDHVGGAKELSIAPINSKGVRLNLVESSKKEEDFDYSVVRVAHVKNMGEGWEFGDIVFHPKKEGIAWIGGHASPGPLFSREFIDVGQNKRLGIMNGREANRLEHGETMYGIFSVGLFVYDFEEGTIDWVSPKPLIIDSEARTITFASQLVQTGNGEAILYAHVDDSFVRAYTLKAEGIGELLPK